MMMLKKLFNKEKSNTQGAPKNTKKNVDINEFDSKGCSKFDFVPKLEPEALYGVIGRTVEVFCNNTEALTVALAAEMMSFVSVCIPRGNAYLPFGAATTEPRVNAIVVAATGEGKGISTRQFESVRKRMEELNNDLACPVFQGGLSTPEGLITLIRDESDTEGLKDVCDSVGNQLLVVEEEMSSIFNIANNSKLNFSPLFRGLFDGTPVSPLTKYNKVNCEKPHVAFFGHITEPELHLVVKTIDIYNGFLNRFPLFIAKRENSTPFPYKIPSSSIDMIASELVSIIEWVKEEEHEMNYSTCFKTLWESEYENLRTLGKENSVERALLSRATHYAIMYSMIFAVLDKTVLINENHLKAALAWIDYWHQSITYIYNTEMNKVKNEELIEKKSKVLEVIKREIKRSENDYIGKTPITRAFYGKYTANEIGEVIDSLQEGPEAKISVKKLPRNALEIRLC